MDTSEAAGVVEAADERPEELDGARERLADSGEHDEAERNADQGVEHRDHAAQRRHRIDVAVTCASNKAIVDTRLRPRSGAAPWWVTESIRRGV